MSPIDYKNYPPDWKQISRRIRFERAMGHCEWCGAVHNSPHPITGSNVILTVHHIGVEKPDGSPGDRNDKMDCRDKNLVALCQRCHLRADQDIRVKNMIRTKWRKKYQVDESQPKLFEE